ncbi:hypothetical protein MA5S0422_0561 [Mycobacteroides abscessus 5S-0422]|uniref:NACHT domain protein n=1 Tax=Mycobacteroides abscessus subsp. bolletii 1513 TaxID=1299321 RepID=X8E2T1_9MYCO|nr:hypothetical protein MA5S0421_5392 [Mycobacteroides abscessus 5S-0421]EIU09148.1 hypothetical protein MA5S0304_5155 [Mycobacteroides abscessus 5S-0304]EIU19252.1 hypothetical protein MA5S0422_0561 [Mycobacteroides abscessus 5S-0422]EIU24043.1 hypothetical protein MA5S0817_4708 [Mycobacteroides abscessus 5S-0817]EIU34471.1 hypothetical protein MA5S0708_0470 [Mycobacteroides abscessus 5S-0708]EIU35645.1 hypothetical protein MA5S1212_0143 [Mycobacteroides abscessus 5S-1212]EIU42364.1 hypothet
MRKPYAVSMDPLTIGTGAYGAMRVFNACARGARDLSDSFVTARRKYRLLGTYSPTLLDHDFRTATSTTGFDAQQLNDIGRFLSSEQPRPLLTLMAVASLTTVPDSKLIKHIKEGLTQEARKWNADKPNPWVKSADAIWDRLLDLHQEILPDIERDSGLLEDIEYFEDFVNTPLQRGDGPPGSYTARFVSQLIKLASDIGRLKEAYDASSEIARHMAATSLDPIITHTDLGRDDTANFESLYIDRSFIDFDGGQPLDSSALTSGNTPFRLVVTGAPGAGKSTYLQHFRRQLCEVQERPVFIVRCREYAATNWDRTNLIDFSIDRYNAEYSDEVGHSTIRDMLTLGRAVMVFDGLDEVTDPLRRIELSRRINSFGSMFPLSSILVTSREIGYERAPLDIRIFTRVQLTEFELEQTITYINKWFTLVKRQDLIDRFIHDSESIPDLRLNPLMLSLLCLLYRESGAIPSGRLGIYEECARLLFHRWDNHRQIKVEGAIPDFSDNLMQEIARWYYTSPSTQGGLDETVIRGMLRRILIDQSGFPEGRADAAAADFLEFCAGRAWLLGPTGSNHRGERLFSFTHKTFSEYFAAEAFARNTSNVTEICDRITQVFNEDSASVLPELLIQSYAKHSAQGASRIVKHLHQDAAPLLLLRLVEGAPLPAYSRKLVFDTVVQGWKYGEMLDRSELISLLQLNPLAREQFVEEYLLVDSEVREIFLSGWAGVVLSGAADRYLSGWASIVPQLIEISDMTKLADTDEAVWNWLAISEPKPLNPGNTYITLVSNSAFGPVPGIAWYTVERCLRFRKPLSNEQVCLSYVAQIVSELNSKKKIPELVIKLLSAIIIVGSKGSAWTVRWVDQPPSGVCFDLFSYVTLALRESYFTRGNIPYPVTTLWSGGLRDVVDVWFSGYATEPAGKEVRDAARYVLGFLPDRLTRWTFRHEKLVKEEIYKLP